MAETLISPGVLARENDQSQVTSQPLQAGACIVGPTVLGKVNIPRLVTSYSEYLANFGSTFKVDRIHSHILHQYQLIIILIMVVHH